MTWRKILPLLTALTATIIAACTPSAAGTCNGQTAYCTRRYSNITKIGAHDSPFVGPLPQNNQNLAVTKQLDFGIRFLQGQTHKSPFDNSIIELCHTSCFLEDAGTLNSFLRTVKTWLDTHPNEVVTLLLTNQDSFPVSKLGDVFADSGIKQYAFTPPTSPSVLAMDEWPTLGEMISNGKRLVVFLGICYFVVHSFPRLLTNRLNIRLWRQHVPDTIHPRRIQLLLRDSLRRNRREIP